MNKSSPTKRKPNKIWFHETQELKTAVKTAGPGPM